MRRKTFFFLFLCCVTTGLLRANPFTGSPPAPARTERPPEFLVERQALLHTQLGESIYEWTKTHSVQTFWTVITLAFFYGFMHALGPGHRKTLVFSFYLSKAAPVWEPALTSVILAGLHGITSIVLLFVFRNAAGAFSANTASAAAYLEGSSYLVLLLLSLFSVLHLLSHAVPGRFRYFHFGCGCCRHQSGNSAVEKAQWGTFVLSGIYPCPAALLVLVLVSSLDAAGLGILAVVSMSAGMAVPITVIAYLAWAGRAGLFKRMQKTEKYLQTASCVLGLAAYTGIFIFSLVCLLPFVKGFIG